MGHSKKINITQGPIMKSIMLYALPIIFGTFLQGLFNAADLMVIGNMTTDETASASVSATSSIVNLLVNSFVGLSAGVSAVLARCLVQRNEARAKRVVSTSIIASFVLGIILVLGMTVFSKSLLRMMDCPVDCFDGAVLYLRIYAFGIPAIMVYNFAAAIIRTAGDTTRPFVFLVAAGLLNVGLNFVLCLIFEQKVAAVAVATAASQLLACILTVIRLIRIDGPCKFSFSRLSFSFRELGGILKIGGPCAFNSALFSLSNVQMQTALNSYGKAAVAGNGAAATLEHFASSMTSGFNSSIVPFVGQNVGAGNKKRVNRSILCCCLLATGCAVFSSVMLYVFGRPLLGLYLPNSTEAVEFGMVRMKYVLLAYGICALYNSFVSSMQAFGYSFIPMINSILTVLVFRVFWLEFIYPPLDAANRIIDNLYVCYTISWTLSLIAHSITFAIIYIRYRKGKVKQI
jgi:putative MATE family efflux protein